jgi:hypothetical protein
MGGVKRVGTPDFVLDIIAQGAWNGGTRLDNSIYENKGMLFKGGVPVNRNLDRLREARTILYDSVGAGMTRSSFLRRA